MFNNTGFGGLEKFHERNWQQGYGMINLNIIALTALTHFFLADFVKRNKCKILNTSSTASLMPGPLQTVYFATKAFVTSFSNTIAEELSETSVTVTNLMPDATKTKFGQLSGMDKTELFKKTVSVHSVALDRYNVMLKGKLDVVSGLSFGQKLMMIFIPLSPKKMVLKQVRNLQEIKKP